ncbi:MAG: hypothetical protein ACKO8I_20280 [Cyanobacteriota bacterium]
MTSTQTDWIETVSAVEILGISRSKLHQLKGNGVLNAGKHWIRAGGRHGRLLWCVSAIRSWQIQETLAAAAGIETYDSLPEAGGVL